MSLGPLIKIDVQKVRYPVVRDAMARLPVAQTEDDPDAQIVWWDSLPAKDDFSMLFPYQRANRIPGMDVLCYKNTFFQALTRMRLSFPSFYNFFPTTYQLPFQFGDFQREHLRISAKSGPTTWILKPRNGCCGNGIRLIQNSFDASAQTQLSIIQRYVSLYLVGGFKFDFRFYILIANVQPLTVFAYREGLARFCSHEYSPPTRDSLGDRFCHLTNTAVNVNNANSTRVILELATSVLDRVADDRPQRAQLWLRIKQIILLAILAEYSGILQNIGSVVPDRRMVVKSARAHLDANQRYFHILGIDIMLNEKREPVVLELNDRPSMCVTYEIEKTLKSQLVYDALNLIAGNGNSGGWEKVLPTEDASPFGQGVQAIMEKASQRAQMNAKRMLAKRLGYVPSSSSMRHSYRQSDPLPRLHR